MNPSNSREYSRTEECCASSSILISASLFPLAIVEAIYLVSSITAGVFIVCKIERGDLDILIWYLASVVAALAFFILRSVTDAQRVVGGKDTAELIL